MGAIAEYYAFVALRLAASGALLAATLLRWKLKKHWSLLALAVAAALHCAEAIVSLVAALHIIAHVPSLPAHVLACVGGVGIVVATVRGKWPAGSTADEADAGSQGEP